jgi:hypothetical protein
MAQGVKQHHQKSKTFILFEEYVVTSVVTIIERLRFPIANVQSELRVFPLAT